MLKSSEREKQAVRDELARELAEAQQKLRQKVTKYSNNIILVDADCRKKYYNPVKERERGSEMS